MTQEPYPPSGLTATSRWWMLAVLFVVALVSYSDRTILNVLVDPLRADLGITDSGVSLLQGLAFTCVYVFASLPLGRLADRRNRRMILVIGSASWCFATVLSGLAPDFRTLFLCRMLVGVSEATLIPASISMIVDGFPADRRGLAIGIFVVATIVGGPAGVTFGGLLYTAAQLDAVHRFALLGSLAPWRLTLIGAGLIGFVGPALLLSVREPPRSSHVPSSTRDAARFALGAIALLLPLYLGMALLAAGDYGISAWAPTSLSRRFGWSANEVGVSFGIVVALTGIAGSLGGGWISDLAARRGGARARLLICIPIAILAAVATLLLRADSPAVVLTGVGLWTCFSALAALGAVAVLQEFTPEQFRGTSMAALTFCNTLIGLGLGPTLVAVVTENVFRDPQAVGHAIGVVLAPAAIAASVFFFVARRAMRRTQISRP